MNKPLAQWLNTTVVVVLLLSGCVTHETTVERDVERTNVKFENDVAARIFYEFLSEFPPGGNRRESNTEVKLPVIFKHQRTVISGPSAAFNQAVAMCDMNKDGIITEVEAKLSAEQRRKDAGG